MPVSYLPSDHELVKLFHLGRTDASIAHQFGVSVQAVNKRFQKLGLARRTTPTQQAKELLEYRWGRVRWNQDETRSHHNRYSAKALKVWLRRRLGDDTLSSQQVTMAERWERRLKREETVLCYNPDSEEGWFYRPRNGSRDRYVIDWPEDLPFPDQKIKRALELPNEDINRTL